MPAAILELKPVASGKRLRVSIRQDLKQLDSFARQAFGLAKGPGNFLAKFLRRRSKVRGRGRAQV